MTDHVPLLIVGEDDDRPIPDSVAGFRTAPVHETLVPTVSRIVEGFLELHRLIDRIPDPQRELILASDKIEEAIHWIERASPRMGGIDASTDHD